MICYNEKQTLNEWVNTIETKFSDIPFNDSSNQIAKILAIDDKRELNKINKASLIVYAKKLDILSFENACSKLGVEITLPDVSKLAPKYRKQQIALYKLSIICEVVNNGWTPNWKDSTEYKYYPWFDMSEGGFSFFLVYYYYTFTCVPSALYLKNRELAEFMGRYFLKLYKDYLKG